MGTQVAVVMPVFNAERFLRESMDSVLAQTFHDFIFLVCDDCSGDGSLSILEEYARRDDRVRVLSNERNLGTVGTRNKLLAALPPDIKYFAIMDADDVSLPDRLERQMQFLESHDETICGVGSSLEIIDEDSRVTGFRPYPVTPEEIRRVLPERNVISQSSLMLRRAAIDVVGGYRRGCRGGSDCCMDYDWWLRLLDHHYDFANLPDPVLRYRMSSSQMKQKKLRSSLRNTMDIQTAYRNRTHSWTLRARLRILADRLLLCLPDAVILKLFEFLTYRRKPQ